MKKIIYCAFGKLGFDCLKNLLENKNYNIIYILTHKENLEFSVDTLAEREKIPYSYVDLRKDERELMGILENNVDYLISINYRYIIPKKIFEKVKFALNIHGSLLPKYRGRTPHVWNIINGEKVTGITCHKIEKIVDTGDIIYQEKLEIKDNYTGNDLLEKMQERYPEILLKSLKKIEKGTLELKKQNEDEATYFGKRVPEMGYISFYSNYLSIYNFIRAQAFPYPGAYYFLENGKKILIDEIEKVELSSERINNAMIGKIINENGAYYVKCLDSIIKLSKYRFEGEYRDEK